MSGRPSGSTIAGCIAAPADDLCLQFVNTRYWRGSEAPVEQLRAIADVVQFAATGGVDAAITEAIAAHWRDHPAAAELAFAAAVELRETLHRVFVAAAGGGAPAPADLAALNAGLGSAGRREAMRVRDGGYAWETALPGRNAVSLLSPVLWSAADLLAGPRRPRVRQCANPRCGWLFLDGTKGGNRRWCSMSACGNREKAHRHYLKHKRPAAER